MVQCEKIRCYIPLIDEEENYLDEEKTFDWIQSWLMFNEFHKIGINRYFSHMILYNYKFEIFVTTLLFLQVRKSALYS